jgi:hypothetical protein
MSTKTMKQRIALVAVSALTAGLFSVVSTPVANAIATPAATLNVATTNSATGTTVLTAATAGDTTLDRSIGFVAVTSADGTDQVAVSTTGRYVKAGTTGTANILAGARLAVSTAATTATTATFNVALVASGGTLSGGVAIAGALTYNGSNTVVSKAADATEELGAILTANPGATSVTLTAYEGTAVSASAPTAGTLIGRWVFTIVSASVSGVYSAADSSAYIGTSRAAGTACSVTPTFDNMAVNASGLTACVYVALLDGYGAGIATGVLSASATNGAKVKMGGGASDAYIAAISYDSASYTAATFISVLQPVASTAGSTVVTISYQGVTVATKTISWTGVAASITLDVANSASTFAASGNAAGTVPAGSKLGINYVIKDAAGNAIAHGAQPSVSEATGSMISANTETAAGAATEQVVQSVSRGFGSTTMYIADSTLRGAGTYKLSITNALGATIKSSVINANVVGSVATFTASWDKATYASGEIATLTIKGLDSGGRPAADGTLLGTGTVISVNTDGFAHLTSTCETTPATSSAFLGGVKTCKFAVKNTAGSYSYSVKVATTTSQSEAVGTVAVSAGTATSNADVLKAIVSLIASINKQIAALQKALLARR